MTKIQKLYLEQCYWLRKGDRQEGKITTTGAIRIEAFKCLQIYRSERILEKESLNI